MSRCSAAVFGITFVLAIGHLAYRPSAAAAQERLRNGSFQEWVDGRPAGWEISVGAQNGQGAASVCEPVGEQGVRLSGEAATMVWHVLSQNVEVAAGDSYRLEFTARARDVRREGQQFDNCYVGVMLKDAHGQRVEIMPRQVTRKTWRRGSVVFQATPATKTVDVMIFLSKSGVLEVQQVSLRNLDEKSSFDVLVDEMEQHYSFFANKQIDWKNLAGRYRRQADAAASPEEFANVLTKMLAELKDPHVSVAVPGGQPQATFGVPYRPNYDLQAVFAQLEQRQTIGKLAATGRTKDGIGYAAIARLIGTEAERQAVIDALKSMRDAPALVVDLRGNKGGDERFAQQIAGLFTDRDRVYARSQYRAGDAYDDFVTHDRALGPTTDEPFLRPVMCLIGPGCISSGEGFALMMKALPHVRMIGQPTRGASGNPQPLELPNGVVVSFSTWRSLLPDGTLLEGRGVPPDIRVTHRPPGDPTFARALQEIRAELGKSSE